MMRVQHSDYCSDGVHLYEIVDSTQEWVDLEDAALPIGALQPPMRVRRTDFRKLHLRPVTPLADHPALQAAA